MSPPPSFFFLLLFLLRVIGWVLWEREEDENEMLMSFWRQLQVKEGIDAVIVDNVLAIRKGLTAEETKAGVAVAV